MAMNSLARTLPKWARWAKSASELEILQSADYVFAEPNLKFLGVIVQKYRVRSGGPTRAFQEYFVALDQAITTALVPALEGAELLLGNDQYAAAGLEPGLRLANIPDFNTLIASAQKHRKPVFTLTQNEVEVTGKAWENTEINVDAFRQTFTELAARIEELAK